jgi:spore germination protein YaaH
MTNRLALIAISMILAACAAAPTARGPSPESDARQEIWAYNAYWMGDAWRAYDLGAFKRLLFFDLAVARDGSVDSRGWPDQWATLRTRARDSRVPIDPVFSILSLEVFSGVFGSDAARARLLSEILTLSRDADGVHLDVEVMEDAREQDVAAYRKFLGELRRALDAPRKRLLTAFVPGRNILYEAPELAMLDAIVAQGYDVHWQASPVAGAPTALEGESPAAWRNVAAMLAKLGASPRKILFSTPFYGYEWPTVSAEPGAATRAPATIITYAPVSSKILPDLRVSALARSAQHGLRRDATTNAPWYAFRDRQGWRQGWFDDPVSLAPRLEFVQRGDYRGVALFVLGYDGGAMLDVIQRRFTAGSAPAGGGGPAAVR